MFDELDASIRSTGRRAFSRWPALQQPLLASRDLWARAYVGTRSVRNWLRYEAPIDPYQILRVDPGRIDRYPGAFPGPKYQYAGLVAGGDWDQTDVRFTDLDVYQAYERHFIDGVPWQDTAFYERILSEIEAGEARWGCTTREAFDRRCDRLDCLYDRIREYGMLSQAELLDAGYDDPLGTRQRLKTERFKDEISIHVDRDGDLLFGDGRNRLAIAKLLDLESIPVRVLVRHREWQSTRDEYVRGEAPPGLDAHPDIRYIAA
jgi:hypothetical protein